MVREKRQSRAVRWAVVGWSNRAGGVVRSAIAGLRGKSKLVGTVLGWAVAPSLQE